MSENKTIFSSTDQPDDMTSPERKLNPEVKEKWVAALRSGQYTQGRNALQTEDHKFCCLGVLCDLYRTETGRGEWKSDITFLGNTLPGVGFVDPTHGVPEFSREPETVRQWAGTVAGNDMAMLADMNDYGTSFEALADYIEKNM